MDFTKSVGCLKMKLVHLFKAAPDLDEEEKGQASLVLWNKLGHMNLDDIMNLEACPGISYGNFQGKLGKYQGMLNVQGNPQGFGRYILATGQVEEGVFDQDINLIGQSRVIYADGTYYLGEMQDGKKSGKGKVVKATGSEEDGEWFDGEFCGSQVSIT